MSLEIRNISISEINVIRNLKGLSELVIQSAKITNIDFLLDLPYLKKIDLSDSKLKDYSVISKIGGLVELYLLGNEIEDISFIVNLKKLERINFANNMIEDISHIGDLGSLKFIWFYGNNISNIDVFEKLKNPGLVERLSLGGNEIVTVGLIKIFRNLKTLHLQDNKIKSIIPIKNLTKLEKLMVGGNLISDITPIKKLKNMQSIDFKSNPIIELPSWITQLDMKVEWSAHITGKGIVFYDNPLVRPPVEIVKQGNVAIDDYLKSIKGKPTVSLNEIKVLLVGEGMAGKTSLLKRLQGGDFDDKESQTHGINVATVKAGDIPSIDTEGGMEDCRLHFWDFGGQEIMHASHQFFMSERALYVLVLDSRTDSKKYYWLKHIEKFGGDSPVILVMNKMDNNPTYNIQQQTLNEMFPNLKNRFFKVSCKDGGGLKELLSCLPQAIKETSLYGTEISLDWMRVKNDLEIATAESNYLDHSNFIKICNQHGVVDRSAQNTLLRYLHDLGVILHFEKLNLNNIFVLDPHWVTIGVYKIINSSKINQGILSVTDLDFILNKEEIRKQEYDPAEQKEITYSNDEQNYLVNIMELFELCYELDSKKCKYIIPDLLPKELPVEPDFNEPETLQFIIEYDYLPSSVISRLMLRLHKDIDSGLQWKFGMVLHDKELDCRAKIKAKEDSKVIHIWVSGAQYKKQKYFAVIKHALTEVNLGFKNLRLKEFVPLPNNPSMLVDYSELLGFEIMGVDEYVSGKLKKTFSVAKMLDCYSDKAQRIEMNEKLNGDKVVVNVKVENVGNTEVNQTNTQDSQQVSNLTATQEQSVGIEISNIQGVFKNIKSDILEELDIEVDDDKDKRRLTNELNKVEKAFDEMAAVKNKGGVLPVSTFERLSEFSKDLQDEDSRIRKAFSLISKGKDKAQKLAASYNKVAPYFSLPNVPAVFLK